MFRNLYYTLAPITSCDLMLMLIDTFERVFFKSLANIEALLVSMETAMTCCKFSCCCERVFWGALEKASYTDTGTRVMSVPVKAV